METISNFQYIWSEWVIPLVDDLYNQLDEEFKKTCNVRKRDVVKIGEKAEQYYQKQREELKKAFYGEYHKGDSEIAHRMDFHKIGAILCQTTIEFKVFDFDIQCCKEYITNHINKYDTNWVVKNALINFRLAFYVSVVFLYEAMIFKYAKDNEDISKALRQQGKLNLYEKNQKDERDGNTKQESVQESFENCIVLDLAKRNIGNHSFDHFMYAIILYQLEEHNIRLLS